MYLTEEEMVELEKLAEQENKEGWRFWKNTMRWYSCFTDGAGRKIYQEEMCVHGEIKRTFCWIYIITFLPNYSKFGPFKIRPEEFSLFQIFSAVLRSERSPEFAIGELVEDWITLEC